MQRRTFLKSVLTVLGGLFCASRTDATEVVYERDGVIVKEDWYDNTSFWSDARRNLLKVNASPIGNHAPGQLRLVQVDAERHGKHWHVKHTFEKAA